jgi:hypothetical protein
MAHFYIIGENVVALLPVIFQWNFDLSNEPLQIVLVQSDTVAVSAKRFCHHNAS